MKPTLRIKGLVRFADQVRNQLVASADPALWQRRTRDALDRVDAMLRQQGLQASDLPAPSRRAYRFLQQADFSRSTPAPAAPAKPATAPRMRLAGLQRDFDQILAALGQGDGSDTAELQRHIASTSTRLENAIARHGASPEQLSQQARGARGWLAHFADPAQLAEYRSAVARCQAAFRSAAASADIGAVELSAEFRPLGGLYRLRHQRDGCRLCMPTAMVSFDQSCLDQLCRHALGLSRQRRQLLEAADGEAFQALQARLETLGGVSHQSGGRVHDLQRSLERVKQRFFGGSLAAPQLRWSGRLSRRKLGHYDPLRDSIVISSTLDSQQVPERVLDFVIYHELLHKQHGVNWSGDRALVHTAAFKHDEQRFPDAADIERFLATLCSKHR